MLVLVLAAAWWYLAVLADRMLAALWCSQVGLAQPLVVTYMSARPMAAMRARAVLCVWRVALRPQAALALCL